MELVTLGGAALRLSPPGNERLETAGQLDIHVTGPECNAAIAADRLGASAAWISRLADDPVGRRVVSELRGKDVEVIAEVADSRQGLSFFERGSRPRESDRVDDLEGAAVRELTMESLPTDPVERADAAYVTSVTPTASRDLAATTAKFLKTAADAATTTVLGVLEGGAGSDVDPEVVRDTLEGLFPVVDVLVAEEAAVEAIFDRSGEPSSVTHALASEYDFETVALHRERTAAAWHASKVDEFVLPEVDVVDETGAADAFAGAFVVSLADDDVDDALRRAIAADALVRTTPGPTPVFTEGEIEQLAETLERP